MPKPRRGFDDLVREVVVVVICAAAHARGTVRLAGGLVARVEMYIRDVKDLEALAAALLDR